MLTQVRAAIVALVVFTVITGILYPLVVTGIAQVIFPSLANGSLIVSDGQVVGSTLIGQPFNDPKYFWGRLSLTASVAYNAAASSGSNWGPTNPKLTQAAQARIEALHDADPNNNAAIPVDLVTSSGSGLDPHISIAAALYQLPRVARARGISEADVRAIVDHYTQGRWLGILGEPAVNVLQVNLALDGVK